MEDLTKEQKDLVTTLTEFALTPIGGRVTRIGAPSIIKMISQLGDATETERTRKIFAVSIQSSLGDDHLLFSDENGIWNGVRNMCQDLAYSNKVLEKDRDAIVGILWSEEFVAKNV